MAEIRDLAHLSPKPSDEIDLGELIRNLIGQWKLIFTITVLGTLIAIIFAVMQPKIYKVTAITSLPTYEQLGEATTQSLIEINSNSAFKRFLDKISSHQVKQDVFINSRLLEELSEQVQSETESLHLLDSILKSFTIDSVTRDYENGNEDSTTLQDIEISLESQHPTEAAAYINELIDTSNKLARREFEIHLTKIKNEKLNRISLKLEQLTDAAQKARQAQISRLEAENNLEIAKLEQAIAFELNKAKEDRLNRISVLKDALITANKLEITTPTSWEVLRGGANKAQITNQIVDKPEDTPLYFQGSQILAAEINRLEQITNDEPFVAVVATHRQNIEAIKNDPVLASLKNRLNDTVYIESLDAIITERSTIETETTKTPNAQFVRSLAPAIAPAAPIKPNKTLIVIAGCLLAGFFSLFIALIKIAMKQD